MFGPGVSACSSVMEADLGRLVRAWREAEQRLYPMVMHRPEEFEGHLEAVREVADALASERTPEELARAWERGFQVAEGVLGTRRERQTWLDVELVAGAGFGIRYREILGELQREEAAGQIREAARRADEWVVLGESGVPGDPPWPYPHPYHRVEMHLPDGAGLHLYVEPDPDSDGAIYGIERLWLDPKSGEVLREGGRSEFRDPARWKDEAERIRGRSSA